MLIDAFRITSPLFAAFSLGVLTMAAASAVPDSVPSVPAAQAVAAQPQPMPAPVLQEPSVPPASGVQFPDAPAEPAPTY